MPTTSNFGWNTPADTDLVKDGALAIRTLGNNIDTSLVDLKGGTTGQILAKNSNTDLDYTWINNDQGDITEVQAGTGISVASGTGPVPVVTNTVATAFDAKGDLVVGTGADTFAKLTTGSNGDTLVADSSTTTGLRWQADWNVGKNKILNSDFRLNQRAFTSNTNGAYGFDRWALAVNDGTTTYSAQTFTAGAAPVAGYEAINFARVATTGQTLAGAYSIFFQKIEDVRVFANQTVTVSFWAKANSGSPKVAVELTQSFGSGGSADVNTYGGQVTLSQAWARYSVTVAVPTISGKTIGTGSSLILYLWVSGGSTFNARTGSLGIQTNTFDFWGVQVEAGSVATPFTTATGTLAGELAACQRYYWRASGGNNGIAVAWSTTGANVLITNPVPMRVTATSIEVSGMNLYDGVTGYTSTTAPTIWGDSNAYQTSVTTTGYTGLTQYRTYFFKGGTYFAASAEL